MRIRISINLGISNISFRPENQNIEITNKECLNLKQHNPNLENTANDELSKETKMAKIFEIRKHQDRSESSITEVEASQKDKPRVYRRKELHLR